MTKIFYVGDAVKLRVLLHYVMLCCLCILHLLDSWGTKIGNGSFWQVSHQIHTDPYLDENYVFNELIGNWSISSSAACMQAWFRCPSIISVARGVIHIGPAFHIWPRHIDTQEASSTFNLHPLHSCWYFPLSLLPLNALFSTSWLCGELGLAIFAVQTKMLVNAILAALQRQITWHGFLYNLSLV